MDFRDISDFWFDVQPNGTRIYSFHFRLVEQTDGEVRIYILSQPPYPSGRSDDGHSTHRYGLGERRPFVCYDPRPLSALDAKAIAGAWARHTVFYQKTGRWIPNHG
jgi:hypothetical protein